MCCVNRESGQRCESYLVFSLCMLKCLAKVQDTAMTLLHYSPSSYFLQRQSSPVCLSYHNFMQLQAVSTFANLVLYHLWLSSIILKPTMHSFLHSAHLNWYMLHHSLVQGESLLSGEIKVPYNKSQFLF